MKGVDGLLVISAILGPARHFNAAGADSMAAAAAGTAKFSEVVDATNLGCCWISFSEIVSS
ncbi:hypothetical protein ACHAXH_003720, partial [Discostella pseudostelligera]